jgi:hypothetical protein
MLKLSISILNNCNMDFKQALELIQNSELEDKDNIAKAINKKLSDLSRDDAKNSRTEALINQLLETIGAEGDDLENKIHSATTKAKTISQELTQAKNNITQVEGKVKQLERRGLLTTAGVKAGANAEVLEKLLADVTDELVVADDGVKIGGKPLGEYAKSRADWKPFLPALFPNGSDNNPNPLPSSPANGQDQQTKTDSVGTYLKATYPVPDYLKNG